MVTHRVMDKPSVMADPRAMATPRVIAGLTRNLIAGPRSTAIAREMTGKLLSRVAPRRGVPYPRMLREPHA